MSTQILRGHDAIKAASAIGCNLAKYADAIDGARADVTIDEAREIANEDPGLLWLEVESTDADERRAADFDDAETFGREAW